MRLFRYIIIVAAPFLLGSCMDLNVNLGGDPTVAKVGKKDLMLSEIISAMPKSYSGEDSVSFIDIYTDRWVRKQLKINEAENIFSEAEEDIEAMVEEYRQSLLIRKLDEQYVGAMVDTTYTQDEISKFYNTHKQSFKLTETIVKYRLVRFPLDYKEPIKLRKLFESSKEDKIKDLLSICEKNDFSFSDFSESWIVGSELIDQLPVVRRGDLDDFFTVRGVQEISDNEYKYYYELFDSKIVGDIAPLEWVTSTIQTILAKERQQNLLRSKEDELYKKAIEEKLFTIYQDEDQDEEPLNKIENSKENK